MKPLPPIPQDWKWGTAEGSRELDRIMDQRLSFREKMLWLEEAETLSLVLQADRKSSGGYSSSNQKSNCGF